MLQNFHTEPPMDIDEYWQAFIQKEGLHPRTEYREAVAFDSDASLRLALTGRKTAICSSRAWWDWLEEDPPESGDFLILTDSEGAPACVAEVMEVRPVTLETVRWEVAALEGEDADLAAWKARTSTFLTREAKRLRKELEADPRLLFTVFELVQEG